jgi:hypothetical protein
MKYKVAWTRGKNHFETAPVLTSSAALFEARKIVATERPKTVTVLRDSEGADHADNAGKFWELYR